MLNITKHKFVGKAEIKKTHSNMFQDSFPLNPTRLYIKAKKKTKKNKVYHMSYLKNSNSIPKIQTSTVLIQRGRFIQKYTTLSKKNISFSLNTNIISDKIDTR